MIANSLLENPLRDDELLEMCSRIEGHPDNITSAKLGGLTISLYEKNDLIVHNYQIPEWKVVVILPDVRLSTKEARQTLPLHINYSDAIYSLGRVPIVVDALREGDLEKLKLGMLNKMHEKYRLALIPGANEAINTARDLGAAATISGAGPSLIAFANEGHQKIMQAMKDVFSEKGISSRVFLLNTTNTGAELIF